MTSVRFPEDAMKPIIVTLLAAAVAVLTPTAQAKKHSSRSSRIPKNVQRVVQAFISEELPGGRVRRISPEKERGTRIFEAVVSDGKKTFELDIDAAGRVLELQRKLREAELPKNVRASLARITADPEQGGTIKDIEWSRTARRESYAITLINRRGREFDLALGPDGQAIRDDDRDDDDDDDRDDDDDDDRDDDDDDDRDDDDDDDRDGKKKGGKPGKKSALTFPRNSAGATV